MMMKRIAALFLLHISLTVSAFSASAQSTLNSVQPAQEVLQRLMPHLASQFTLAQAARVGGKDYFRISGVEGHIKVEGGTLPTLLAGVNWYLKYVAHLQVSPNGSQLGSVGLILPAPSHPIEQAALYPWRYALNENVDGYTAPYWDEDRWQREIDILALSGINAILIERGTDYVLYKMFRDAGYSDEAIRRWITQPAHQNWQLMGNICCYDGPISLQLLKKRAASTQKIIASLRRLGITPVLPGYYGIVPSDFDKVVPGAHVIEQGNWSGGFIRPGWIDPRDPHFSVLAHSFYRYQHEIFGDSTIYDMEIFQEGGKAGDVPIAEGASRIQAALQRAHPGALWMLMGWQNNPTGKLLAALDPKHVIIADIRQGRIPEENRDREFLGIPWFFGGIWEFGGRTTMGAPLYDYAVRLPKMAQQPGNHIVGTALFPEALDTNPYAFDLYTEMAWHREPVNLADWTDEYIRRRYGAEDEHARQAWRILLETAYGLRADIGIKQGEAGSGQESLFNAQPSLNAKNAFVGAPAIIRYDPVKFQRALTELLQVAPRLRETETYRYDLVDVARQTMANESRRLLPEIRNAYETRDKAGFAKLTATWLHDMQLQDDLLQTDKYFLVGNWLSYVPRWASSPAELDVLNFDARSILTTWGERRGSEASLHDYANKDWAGLTRDYYMLRWKTYFGTLQTSLETGEEPKPIDWYALGDEWNHGRQSYSATPQGDTYAAAMNIATQLGINPARASSGIPVLH